MTAEKLLTLLHNSHPLRHFGSGAPGVRSYIDFMWGHEVWPAAESDSGSE